MKISDIYQNEVMHFHQPYACWMKTVEVSAADQIIGHIEQQWTLMYPSYTVKNHNNEAILRIEGPMCTSAIFGDVDFRVSICLSKILRKYIYIFFWHLRVKVFIIYESNESTTDFKLLFVLFVCRFCLWMAHMLDEYQNNGPDWPNRRLLNTIILASNFQ